VKAQGFRTLLTAVVLSVAAAVPAVAVAKPAVSATAVRVMPLGDSITAGPGC